MVIGLSAGRPHPLVIRAMKIARHRKARAKRKRSASSARSNVPKPSLAAAE